MNYRADIDGLRAIAVCSVVLFHANIPYFSGGFIGVDIFFVISGYLISTILMGDLAKNRFSIVTFYERRVRRIFPALFFVCAFTILVSSFIMVPHDFENLGQSLLAAIFFYSNIFFWQDTDYFGGDAELKPLLHTWTLSLEEQFYIFFPIVLWGLYRWQRPYLFAYFLVGIIVSFALSVWAVQDHQKAAFYLLPTRAWELLLGVILSLGVIRPLAQKYINEFISLTGLALILIGLFGLDKDSVFPGANALYPCVGAALIIYAGQGGGASSLVAKFLSFRPIVFLGLISYSLYLFHWPFLALGHYYTIVPLTAGQSALAIVGAFLLASFSWAYVEQPFRLKRDLFPKVFLFKLAGVGMAAFLLLAASMVYFQGVPERFSEKNQALLAYEDFDKSENYLLGTCMGGKEDSMKIFNKDLCFTPDHTKRNYLILGDSHAVQYRPGLEAAFPDAKFLQGAVGGCAAIKDYQARDMAICRDLRQYLFDELLPHVPVDGIFIAARWDDIPEWKGFDMKMLDETLSYVTQFHPENVYLVGPIPTYKGNVPQILWRFDGKVSQEEIFQKFLNYPIEEIDQQLRHLAEKYAIQYISPYQSLCSDAENCQMRLADTDIPMQWDKDHLSKEASVWLVEAWKEQGILRF